MFPQTVKLTKHFSTSSEAIQAFARKGIVNIYWGSHWLVKKIELLVQWNELLCKHLVTSCRWYFAWRKAGVPSWCWVEIKKRGCIYCVSKMVRKK
jgi:hypothetical protein